MFNFFEKEEEKYQIMVLNNHSILSGEFRPRGPAEARDIFKEVFESWKPCQKYIFDISNVKYMNSCVQVVLSKICIEGQSFTTEPIIVIKKGSRVQESFAYSLEKSNKKFSVIEKS